MFKCIFREGNVYKCLLNGEWIESKTGQRDQIFSPTDGALVGEVQAISKEEANHFVLSAQAAQKAWAKVPVTERAAVVHKAAEILEREKETIADILVKEIAKNKKSALSEIMRTADLMHFTAEEGKRVTGESLSSDVFPGYSEKKLLIVNRVPLGVVLCISPFNYPVNLAASKIAPALVAGNSVVFKPPTQGAIAALYLARVFCEAGVPPGVLNVLTGQGREIGDYLVSHSGINMIAFTGSSKVGKHIATLAGMKPLLLELGGKDAAIVLPDADIQAAAKHIVAGAFSYSGQRCTAVKRILIIESVANPLIDALLPLVKKLTVGKPENNADITPLISNAAADYVQELIDDAIGKGAKLLTGNQREKNLMYPTIFDSVTREMRLAWEEPFGPVLPIMRVKNANEAIQIANESEYGLQTSVFTSNIDQAFEVAEKLEVGTVQINSKTERGPDHFPFMGVKSSGLGTQGIRYSIEAMSRSKAIVLNFK
ncbi:MAG: glyceraldehyde-3-phosphate dehydrogenase [Omnitrophica bacterium RIFCSPLOWO2_12_FULL_44_17]|uniref:Glyceraldehyde-3-phosphate dehydrogenase n=1 Tax=Candidatus Danuiimicrobium aquiferis TaxID=1801832 RepID=A0A1G1KXA2_9BACT|nr:MAG: glyceraldehyde-3-phosphate dehydrogenase [Omnitrophica bacterium RIFCSPHIGHO2_02_FULL_45_28]OGW97544.1 MAG: glyceraldehyde-3-phosphate dehydrogenase [Omnitrophica bacterium RIFCSPLOWO2_12_FULL_44_17]OGX02096.1 MAG: glyceraldehyde-3-phosphate dehydrogenase [Omnitrophica bacterium RIFCSPLOWO2_02_FULL_44_11]